MVNMDVKRYRLFRKKFKMLSKNIFYSLGGN